jgi:hypothetical protein
VQLGAPEIVEPELKTGAEEITAVETRGSTRMPNTWFVVVTAAQRATFRALAGAFGKAHPTSPGTHDPDGAVPRFMSDELTVPVAAVKDTASNVVPLPVPTAITQVTSCLPSFGEAQLGAPLKAAEPKFVSGVV